MHETIHMAAPRNLSSEVEAVHAERLRELSERPNTEVLTVEHDATHDPWPPRRLRNVMESITQRAVSTPREAEDDVRLRKRLLDEDPEVLAFQRHHPKLYYVVTDRTLMADPRYRNAIKSMLHIRDEVARGTVGEGQEADAMATSAIVQSLSSPAAV